MKTSNPVMKKKDLYSRYQAVAPGQAMTVAGTINKAGFLILLTLTFAFISWNYIFQQSLREGMSGVGIYIVGSILAAFVISLVIIFKPTTAPVLSPVYAITEGFVLGAISLLMDRVYPGIAAQAIIGTLAVFCIMLAAYKFKIVTVNEKFKSVMGVALFGVLAIYLVGFVGSFFGLQIPYIHESGPIGMGFSVVVCLIASFCLLLDFDRIEEGAQMKAPKFMEWYSAFGLLLTLVWLYMEILRLLAKARR